jgi:hypothetical protein
VFDELFCGYKESDFQIGCSENETVALYLKENVRRDVGVVLFFKEGLKGGEYALKRAFFDVKLQGRSF